MEKHKELLNQLCRICCAKINLSSKYKYPKLVVEFKEEVSVLFNYDLSRDLEEVHPPKLCERCVRQMRRVNAALRDEYIIQEIGHFFRHEDGECKVCLKSTPVNNFKLIKAEKLTVSMIIQKAKENGFLYVENPSVKTKHTFVRVKQKF